MADEQAKHQGTPAEEAVARKLCAWSEYHQANWRLYLPRARELIALVTA